MLGNWKRAVDFLQRPGRTAPLGGGPAAAILDSWPAAFATQLDDVAMRAARKARSPVFMGGSFTCGARGKKRWLCREAPANPAFDGGEEAFDDETLGKRGVARRSAGAPVHARSLRDALERAEDGDRVVLLRGVHNGCGDSVTVTKRVLITGEGALRDAVVDASQQLTDFPPPPRAGCQRRLRLHRVLRGVAGGERRGRHAPRTPSPLIERCGVKCSGSDAARRRRGPPTRSADDVEKAIIYAAASGAVAADLRERAVTYLRERQVRRGCRRPLRWRRCDVK